MINLCGRSQRLIRQDETHYRNVVALADLPRLLKLERLVIDQRTKRKAAVGNETKTGPVEILHRSD